MLPPSLFQRGVFPLTLRHISNIVILRERNGQKALNNCTSGWALDMADTRDWPHTPWSTILQVREQDPACARQALRALLDLYYEPILGYMRAHAPPSDAEEWTHAFVEKVIENSVADKADPAQSLHHYLVAAMRNFIVDRQRHGKAETILKERLAGERARMDAAERAFQRRWAEIIVQRGLASLQAGSDGGADAAPGAEDLLILCLKYGVGHEPEPCSYAQIRAKLGRDCPDHEIDNALRRARKALLGAVRKEVQLLAHSDEGQDEELWRLSQLL